MRMDCGESKYPMTHGLFPPDCGHVAYAQEMIDKNYYDRNNTEAAVSMPQDL